MVTSIGLSARPSLWTLPSAMSRSFGGFVKQRVVDRETAIRHAVENIGEMRAEAEIIGAIDVPRQQGRQQRVVKAGQDAKQNHIALLHRRRIEPEQRARLGDP